jgi:polyhydroxybutyrate depolymerase
VASLAGAMYEDASKCKPSGPVAALQIHGTADDIVAFEGSATGLIPGAPPYPGAETSVEDWATIDGCAPIPDTSGPPLDLDVTLAGAETLVSRWSGCKAGGAAELWAIQGAGHIPSVAEAFRAAVVDWLFAHSKP